MSASNLPMAIPSQSAWNHGRIIGQKRPLLPKHVWAIRVRLELADATRDLALFNMAVDSKLRGCDLVRLKVADVFASGAVKERASILQSKTSTPVRFEITDGIRRSLTDWIAHPLMKVTNTYGSVVSMIARISLRASMRGCSKFGLRQLD